MVHNIIQRKRKKIPSVRKHGLSAILLLALIVLSTYSWLQITGKRVNLPAQRGPESVLAKPETPNINTVGEALPDLLSTDNIPIDVNPTETQGMLGGPDTVTTDGPRPPSESIVSTQNTSGPKTILIDGTPITEGPSNIANSISRPLTKAPIQGLSRMSPFGPVPKIAQNGRTVYTSYAKPFMPVAGQKYIAIIIGGLGLNASLTQRAITELPGEVTLSFAATAPNLQHWIDRARASGHEVLIEIPLQSTGYKPQAIATDYTLTQAGPHSKNIRNLDYLLSRAQGYFAVTNYGGEVLIKDQAALLPIFKHLQTSGLAFIYDGAMPDSILAPLAQKLQLPFTAAHGLLDATTHDRKSVRMRITNLNTSGTKIAIGMGFSYAGTIDGVKNWLLDTKTSVKLAPISYALKTN